MPPFTLAGGQHPIGFSVLAMLGGLLGASFLRLPESWIPGLRWTANFLIPIAIVLLAGVWLTRSIKTTGTKKKPAWLGQVPWFVWGFVLMIALRSFGLLPVLEFEASAQRVPTTELFAVCSKWLLAISLGAIGLQIRLKSLLQQNRGTLAMLAAALCGWLVLSAAAFLVATLAG